MLGRSASFIILSCKYLKRRVLSSFRVLPILISFPILTATVQICSEMNSIINLDLKVVLNVLEEMEDVEVLKKQLRDRILLRISVIQGVDQQVVSDYA